MFNSGIGPVITKKLSKMNPQQKKPMPSGAMAMMYSSQMMNQNKMGMPPNMNMPNNPMNAMKDPNMGMPPQGQIPNPNMPNPGQQPLPSGMKIETLGVQPNSKGGQQFMINNKGTISSPSPIQTQGTPKEMAQMPTNPAMTGVPQMGTVPPINVSAAAMATMKVAEKEPQKTFELMTLSLKIGGIKFTKDSKITTKFIPGKKQIIFEVVDVGSPTKSAGGDEELKPSNKRRFETKFSDIDKVDVITADNLVKIETKEKPTEFKEHTSALKKTSQWIKENTYETESEVGDEEAKNGLTIITAKFKDNLTKSAPGKVSHLDKLKRCEFSLYVDGKVVENQPTPMKITLPFENPIVRTDSSASLPPLALNLNPSISQYGGPKMGDLSLQHQNSLSMSRTQSIAPTLDLNPFPKDTGAGSAVDNKIQEEAPAEAEEDDEDDEDKEFPRLTKDKKIEVKKFEAQLKNMKDDDKTSLIMETIKPKRFGLQQSSKKIFKCPIYKCHFNKPSIALLKSHLSQKHHKVLDMGFKMDENGTFSWKSDLLDFSLMVAKIYPKFVKNIIKEAKKGV